MVDNSEWFINYCVFLTITIVISISITIIIIIDIYLRGYAPCRRPQDVLPGAVSGGLNCRVEVTSLDEAASALFNHSSAQVLMLHLRAAPNMTMTSRRAKTPKHHGSEGLIGPAARSPEGQPSLSEPTRNYSSKP